MRKAALISTAVVAALGLLVAYNVLAETRFYNFAKSGWERSRLDDARAKWEKNGYTSYVMEVTAADHGCLYDLGRAHILLVINDRVISTHSVDKPGIEEPPSFCQNYTVNDIFRRIDSALSNRDRVRVSYDKKLGYPVGFFWSYGDIDHAMNWELESLTPDLDTYADQQAREKLIAERR